MRRSGKSRVLPTSKKMAANGEDILLHDRTPTRPNRLRPGLSARAAYQESVDKRQQKQKAPISRSQESLSWCNPVSGDSRAIVNGFRLVATANRSLWCGEIIPVFSPQRLPSNLGHGPGGDQTRTFTMTGRRALIYTTDPCLEL